MKVLVTGANSLLGHHVVIQLIENQHDVSIIVRSKNKIYFDISKVTVIEGSFINEEQLRRAAQNCEAIIHIAAQTSTNLLHYNDYSKVNVEGSAMVLKIANELNINNIVFVSTANTIGYGRKDKLSDETKSIEFPFSKSLYAQSKLAAEKLFIAASQKANQHIIIINPSFMIGSYDTKPSSGKLILMAYKKPIMFAPKGGKNFVAVSDVAVSICNALSSGKNGQHYLTSGVNLSIKDFYKIQSRVGGYNQKIILIPNFLLEMIGKIGDLIRLIGVKTDICSMNLNQLTIQEYYKNDKAVKELEMPEKSIEIAINEAINWFKSQGKVK